MNATDNNPYAALGEDMKAFFLVYGSIHRYLSISLSIFGIIANTFNIIVLAQRQMHSSVNWILVAIAAFDIQLMASNLPFSIHFIPWPAGCEMFTEMTHGWMSFLQMHANYSIFCHTMSLWLTVVLAGLRYVIIRFSTTRLGALANSTKSVPCIVLTSMTICTLLCIPNLMCTVMHETRMDPIEFVKRNCSSNTINQTYYTMSRECDKSTSVASYYITAFMFKIVPCGVLVIFVTLLIVILCQASARRRRLLNSGSGGSNTPGQKPARTGERTTLLLFTIAFVTLLTEAPQGILTALSSILGSQFYFAVYLNLGDFLDLLSLVNCCSTYIIYSVMSKKFREVFARTFCLSCFRRLLSTPVRWSRSGFMSPGHQNNLDYTVNLMRPSNADRDTLLLASNGTNAFFKKNSAPKLLQEINEPSLKRKQDYERESLLDLATRTPQLHKQISFVNDEAAANPLTPYDNVPNSELRDFAASSNNGGLRVQNSESYDAPRRSRINRELVDQL